MPNSVHELERRRADIVQKIAGLGDLRPGSITTTQGKCESRHAHCGEADHPGHGPHWRLTYKWRGEPVRRVCRVRRKTEGRSRGGGVPAIPTTEPGFCGSEYCNLSVAIVESVAPEEKKRRKPSKGVAQEIDQLLRVIFADLRKSGRWTWKRWRWPLARRCIKAGAACSKNCCRNLAVKSPENGLPLWPAGALS